MERLSVTLGGLWSSAHAWRHPQALGCPPARRHQQSTLSPAALALLWPCRLGFCSHQDPGRALAPCDPHAGLRYSLSDPRPFCFVGPFHHKSLNDIYDYWYKENIILDSLLYSLFSSDFMTNHVCGQAPGTVRTRRVAHCLCVCPSCEAPGLLTVPLWLLISTVMCSCQG